MRAAPWTIRATWCQPSHSVFQPGRPSCLRASQPPRWAMVRQKVLGVSVSGVLWARRATTAIHSGGINAASTLGSSDAGVFVGAADVLLFLLVLLCSSPASARS